MRRMCTATIAAAAMTLLTVAMAPPVWADGPGDRLYGDLNADRLTDRATLADGPTNRCAVVVELALFGGGYQPSKTYTYPVPGGPDGYCPDMGGIVDLGGDGSTELVVAWFAGRPPGVDTDLLVLRDFTPAGGFAGIFQPSFLGLADFNGDGRQDIYEWTDQGEGFVSYLNTPDGRLTPGPVRFPFCGATTGLHLADFLRGGGRGLAIGHVDMCDDFATGVTVVCRDGRSVPLERDPAGELWWQLDVPDVNDDQIPDVRTDNVITGEVTHFLSLGDCRFVESPRAVADRAYVSARRPSIVDILGNDAATRRASVTITVQPKFGSVQVNRDRTVTYTPLRPHDGGDRFVYRLNQDGKQHTTAVSMRFTA